MESDNIEKLLEKYFEASTTVKEEAELKAYFSQEDVEAHLAPYAPMFRYISDAGEERSSRAFELDDSASGTEASGGSSRKIWLAWASAAAMVALMVGLYVQSETTPPTTDPDNQFVQLEDEFTQEEIESAQEALSLLAVNFSKGTEQFSHLQEFEKNTNRFLSEKN